MNEWSQNKIKKQTQMKEIIRSVSKLNGLD